MYSLGYYTLGVETIKKRLRYGVVDFKMNVFLWILMGERVHLL